MRGKFPQARRLDNPSPVDDNELFPDGEKISHFKGPLMPKLILASTSPYRKELLSRLAVPFEAMKPLIDEEKEKDPSLGPHALAEHLAALKAKSLASAEALVLGGDQLVAFEGDILGKPGTQERAIEQLSRLSGETHELVTAICLAKPDGSLLRHLDVTRITFRKLSRAQIENVVRLDNPVDCAGSYKIERHGISLIEDLDTQDFTAIQGLPLLALSGMLTQCGLAIPSAARSST